MTVAPHEAQPPENGADERTRILRLIARLRAEVAELDAASLPGEAPSRAAVVVRLFDITVTRLYGAAGPPDVELVRSLVAACGAGAARLVPLEWGRRHFVHQFLTREFVEALAARLRASSGAPVLEVGAGRGDLARALRGCGVPVVATDEGSWLDGRLRWPRGVPEGVERLDYRAALARYRPGIVLCSWMPQGEDWTPAFRACPGVREYVLIGEEPGGSTGTRASFEAPPPWRRASLDGIARHGFTRNPDRGFRTAVYRFWRAA